MHSGAQLSVSALARRHATRRVIDPALRGRSAVDQACGPGQRDHLGRLRVQTRPVIPTRQEKRPRPYATGSRSTLPIEPWHDGMSVHGSGAAMLACPAIPEIDARELGSTHLRMPFLRTTRDRSPRRRMPGGIEVGTSLEGHRDETPPLQAATERTSPAHAMHPHGASVGAVMPAQQCSTAFRPARRTPKLKPAKCPKTVHREKSANAVSHARQRIHQRHGLI